MIPIRDENPRERTPYVTWLLILANIAVFVWQLNFGLERSVFRYGFIPLALHEGEWAELGHVFTSMFMHGGWLHLIFNLWFLHVFGDNIEDELGHGRYLLFYLLCGIGADVAHYVSDSTSIFPVVGASGAISGVLGGYLMRHPMAWILTFTGYWLIELPAIVFLGIWALLQFLSVMASSGDPTSGGGVAYWAHLGGLFAGIVLVMLFTNPRKRRWQQGEW
jgi:membrane associated rhomboid family serine protease